MRILDNGIYRDMTEEEINSAKYNEISYEETVVALIRERYSLDDELAIHRQKDTKPDEWQEYNAFCEECKAKAKGGDV